jgi:hypothetical protein
VAPKFAVNIDAVCVAVDFRGEGHGVLPFLPLAIKRELPSVWLRKALNA